MEMLQSFLGGLEHLRPEEVVQLFGTWGVGGGAVIGTLSYLVIGYIITNLGNALIFSIAPAIWFVVKKMKDSNKHGDSSSEFQHLRGSRMKILYASETIFYLKYIDECKKIGINSKIY